VYSNLHLGVFFGLAAEKALNHSLGRTVHSGPIEWCADREGPEGVTDAKIGFKAEKTKRKRTGSVFQIKTTASHS